LVQARDNKKRISLDADLAGLQGTLYAPAAQLTLGKRTEIAMTLIVDRLKLDGGATSNLITDGSNHDPETGSPVIAQGHLLSDVVSVALLDRVFSLRDQEDAGDIPEDLDLQLGKDAHLTVDVHTGSLRSVFDHPA
jgi:hypothetical protein